MAQADSWKREFDDAIRLADDVNARVSEIMASAAAGHAESSHQVSAARRKITMLGTKLDSLQSLLNNPNLTKSLSEKDIGKRHDMVSSLRGRMNQMTNNLSSLQAASRSSLLGQEGKVEPKENSRTSGLDNTGIIGLQRQIMREQDDSLSKLETTITSTKHIALAVNEELDLHTQLLDELDQDADATNTRLKNIQRKLTALTKKASSGWSLMCLMLMILVIVALVLVIFLLIRYL